MEQEKITNQKRPSFWQYNKTTADTLKLINSKNVDKSKPMYLENATNNKRRKPRPGTAKNNEYLMQTGGLNRS